jgi:hypothetical protein
VEYRNGAEPVALSASGEKAGNMITSNHPEQAKAFSFLLFLFGVVIIYGTAKRWETLICPPRHVSFWFMNMIRDNFGEESLVLFNYIAGCVAACTGILLFIVIL